jgi:cyclic beta-1,2-glucan synthetase
LADRLLRPADSETGPPDVALHRFDQVPLPPALTVQLAKRLCDRDASLTPALRWLNESLATCGTAADQLVREQHQKLSAMNVTVRNVITSMRLISEVDWSQFSESVSLVDAALRAASDLPT